MKNAQYEKKLRKLISEAGKCHAPSPVSGMQLLRTMIEGVLQIETTPKQSAKALSLLEKEFVDFNELRSAASRDVVECVGRDFPLGREKAEMMTRALTRVFEKASDVSADYMLKMSRKELQQHLEEIGLSPFAAAYVMLEGFGGHSIPVDPALAECLEMEQCIKPGMEIEQIQSLLERLTPSRQARAIHRHMRVFVEKLGKPLQKRRAEAAAKAAQLAAQQAARQEKAAAKARAQQERAQQSQKVESKQPEQPAQTVAKAVAKTALAKPVKSAAPAKTSKAVQSHKPVKKAAGKHPPAVKRPAKSAGIHKKATPKPRPKKSGVSKRKK